MRNTLLALVAVLCSILASAQVEEDQIADTEEKMVDHFVGVQANQLLRQIISLSTVQQVENPYLLNYTLRFNESNFAISAGVGFTKSNAESEENLESESSDLDFRLGLGQQFRLSKLLEVGYSLDFNMGRRKSLTQTTQVIESQNQTDSTVTRTEFSDNLIGAGLRANLLFYITPKILVGTEASYNFSQLESKFEFTRETIISENGEVVIEDVQEQDSTDKGNSFNFNVPIQIFLILKF